ncbi:DEAD/DEAH box helicase family protein [Fluviicola taffensis]|uniref:DEAD/DEAH box helicase family protein n=1 Tax=Fluviicola taffensis TaxID=191579 RepID=UPI00313822EF
MTEFPKDITFKYSWRKYQQRVLDELQDHLTDKHLHVIAPPGSGKTILGLEVALRLNNPTLILAPSIAIRNQWIQRFCELFLQIEITPDWISRDIRNPGFLTVVTYQGMHAACDDLIIIEEENEEEEIAGHNDLKSTGSNVNKIIQGLEVAGIQTIVVDEAHHLKNEWWQTLTKIKERLDPVIVGLTATPPYDVTLNEWQRYIQLNGPVDAEISVPELVIEGDLCPHQDYVYFNFPSESEKQRIDKFRQIIERQFLELKNDETIIRALKNHPIWIDPLSRLDWIYNNLTYYCATLIFLNANGIIIPEKHLEVIGDKKLDVPLLDYKWMETLLDFYLFNEKEHFKTFDGHRKGLETRLRESGAIERKQINFSQNVEIAQSLTSSIGKLNSIHEIVDFEYDQLKNKLRMVILSDFIRKEFFVNSSENTLDINRLGVIPIFEKLRRENLKNKKIGVLTGSLIIIPKSAHAEFKMQSAKCGLSEIETITVPYDSNYIQIVQTNRIKNDIIQIITQIFQQGEIEILIGTKSLLGEGWDAPAINSLILASFVGSFVLSNQMRGRAIRTQKDNVEKTGNIWHLVTIDPTSVGGGEDLDLLKRRFKGFVGVSFKDEPGIENGIDRLNLPKNFVQKETVAMKNEEIRLFAANREALKERWNIALEAGVILIEEIKIPFSHEKSYQEVKSMYLTKTIASLIASLGFSALIYLETILNGISRSARNIRSLQDFYFYLIVIGIGGLVFFGRSAYKTLKLYIKYRDIAKDVKKIGNALLNTLIKSGVIHTEKSKLKVESSKNRWGGVYCHLEGGTTFEKSTFINSLQEIVGLIDNPRYVIERRSRLIGVFKQVDYHSVPDIIGKNKSSAEYFMLQWSQLVGSCYLIFTRTLEGRKLLLKSRLKSLSNQMSDEEIDHVNKWK